MASGLGISMAQAPKVVDDIVFDVIQSQFSSAVAIHITTVMLEAAVNLGQAFILPYFIKKACPHVPHARRLGGGLVTSSCPELTGGLFFFKDLSIAFYSS